ncbi:MAG: transporter substrate-binding domain-containing protein [Deltaproteobacteria bacterium]|nr:MAG: transporter substrate-binding domain-containing protein [Deltaproteobacteria bacterium]
MKKILLPIALLLIGAIAPPSTIANTRVKVGVYQNIPLTFIERSGKVKGFFTDILEYIAFKEGWEIQYLPESWPQCLENLKNGDIDLLGVIAYSEERAKYFDYTYESILAEWGQIYVHKGSDIESLLDLKGRKVAVLQNDMHYINLRNLVEQTRIRCRFIEAFEYEDVMKLVERGICDAGLVSQFYGMQHEGDYDIIKSHIILSPQKLYYATRKGQNSKLLDTLDHYLRQLKNNEQSIYHQSINKWFGVRAESSGYIKWLVVILFGTGGLFALFFSISLVLRKKVKSRTRELFITNEELRAEIEHRRQAENQRLELEAQLQRAQKMEAIGTLAGGVAHDLNNILSGLVSYPELLLMDLPQDSPFKKPILTIKESGEKAATIVQDLLTLARRGVAATEVVNLNSIITDYLQSPEFKKLESYYPNIRFETELETHLLNIMGSQVHLAKTVMNLISNASEATPYGGKILISTENRYVDTPVRGYDDVEEGDYVLLTISDTGVGISSEERERIFEPFYTKKVMGRSGTGLGMAVVWGTVKDHNGYIDVRSAEGQGTTFSLYFPVTREEIPVEKTRLSIENYKSNGENILVIDDVEEQREIAAGMLTKLGYSVAAVSSGEEAVEYMKKNSADILVLDMIMDPGMDGLDTYKKIIDFRPGQKAIIASGYSETDRVREAQRLGAGRYLKKPYTLEKIGAAIRKELDK